MTDQARGVLTAFEGLSPREQHQVAVAILRRLPDYGDVPDEELHAVADELFQMYDAEEAARAPDVQPR